MISQKESSINDKTVSRDEYDPQTYAKVQEMVQKMQQQYRVARTNEWCASQGQASVADTSSSCMYELVSRMRYLESEVRYLKEIVNVKSLWLDASIEEIYGDWV